MKTLVLLKEIASVSIIGFLLLVIITSLGCGILSILRIGLTKRNSIGIHPDYPFTIIAGYQQGGSGDLTIQY